MITRTEAKPVVKVQPRYPIKALKQKIEGSVTLAFELNDKGTPVNIKIVNAKPKKIFDASSIEALKRWLYLPVCDNGVEVNQPMEVTLSYAFGTNPS